MAYNKYTYRPYNTLFPLLFKNEKERIHSALPQALIEHIGSTAVPGLGGKGIIDIAIAVDKTLMDDAKSKLQELGYEFRPSFSTPDRLYFIIYLPDEIEETRRCHVHLTYPECMQWKNLIGFRDFLKCNRAALQEYADLKKRAARAAKGDGEKYRKMKESMFQKFKETRNFVHAKPQQRDLLHKWFEQKHIKEWMHGVGLQSTLDGLEKFFEGQSTTTYWLAYDHEIPFTFLITSPEDTDAITLDVFICDLNYLGKGLAVPMIREFLVTKFSHVKRVLIDPEVTNTRAVHVYKKVGFKITGEFIASWHPVPHYQMEVKMDDLLNKMDR